MSVRGTRSVCLLVMSVRGTCSVCLPGLPHFPDVPRLHGAVRTSPFPRSVGIQRTFPGWQEAALEGPLQAPAPRERVTPVSMPLALLSAVGGQEDSMAAAGDALAEQQMGDAQSHSQPRFSTAQAWAARAEINDLACVLFFCPIFSFGFP